MELFKQELNYVVGRAPEATGTSSLRKPRAGQVRTT